MRAAMLDAFDSLGVDKSKLIDENYIDPDYYIRDFIRDLCICLVLKNAYYAGERNKKLIEEIYQKFSLVEEKMDGKPYPMISWIYSYNGLYFRITADWDSWFDDQNFGDSFDFVEVKAVPKIGFDYKSQEELSAKDSLWLAEKDNEEGSW